MQTLTHATMDAAPAPAGSLALNSKDLQVRMALATPADAARGIFFNGVLNTVESLLGREARERCQRESGERKRFVDFFNYPMTAFLPMTFLATELLVPKLGSYEHGFRRMGTKATTDFLETPMGKTMLMLAGRDPRRLLPAIPGAFKTCVTYGERAVAFSAPTCCVFTMRRDFMPHPYHEGVLQAVIKAMGVSHVEVQGRRTGALDAEYTIRWS